MGESEGEMDEVLAGETESSVAGEVLSVGEATEAVPSVAGEVLSVGEATEAVPSAAGEGLPVGEAEPSLGEMAETGSLSGEIGSSSWEAAEPCTPARNGADALSTIRPSRRCMVRSVICANCSS